MSRINPPTLSGRWGGRPQGSRNERKEATSSVGGASLSKIQNPQQKTEKDLRNLTNKLAKEIAEFLGGQAVITTASDVNNMTSIDLWAKENGLIIDNCNLVPQVATRFINKGKLKVYSEVEIKMPEGFLRTDKPSSADVLITNKKDLFTHSPIHPFTQLYLRPKNLIIGIVCNFFKQKTAYEILA